MSQLEECARMREASGSVDSNNLLIIFLYTLLRDEVTPGRIEKLLDSINTGATEWQFTNGWLARYAEDLAQRLTPPGRERRDELVESVVLGL